MTDAPEPARDDEQAADAPEVEAHSDNILDAQDIGQDEGVADGSCFSIVSVAIN